MELVVIESPLSGDFARNRRYAVAAMRDSLLNHGEAPYASHLLYTQMLDDDAPDERKLGMEAGFEWGALSMKTAVYTDFGISSGMQAGIDKALARGAEVVYRSIPDWESMEITVTEAF